MWTTLITAVDEEDPSFYRFLERIRSEGIRVIGSGAVAAAGGAGKSARKRESLLLTDKPEAAKMAKNEGMPCVFLEHAGTQPVCGVPYILQGVDGIGRDYLQMVYSRYRGEPLVIAKTERLYIRELVSEEAERFFALGAEAGLMQEKLPVGQREFVRSYRKYQYGFYGYGFWSLVEKDSGAWAGIAGAEGREDGSGRYLELGYAVVPEKRRRGYAKEACMAVFGYLQELFGEEEERCRIKCFVPKGNMASQRTAQSIGMLQTEEVLDKFYCYERIF